MSRFLNSTLLPSFIWGVSLLKPNSRRKGILTVQGLLRDLCVEFRFSGWNFTAFRPKSWYCLLFLYLESYASSVQGPYTRTKIRMWPVRAEKRHFPYTKSNRHARPKMLHPKFAQTPILSSTPQLHLIKLQASEAKPEASIPKQSALEASLKTCKLLLRPTKAPKLNRKPLNPKL